MGYDKEIFVKKLFDVYKETMLSPKEVLEKAIRKAVPQAFTHRVPRISFLRRIA